MAHENQEDVLIRRYLLGQLAEDERQQLEEKMMADNELFNRVLLAEDEMVDEYVQGELSESEREGFEDSFLSTADGRKQVSFARALSQYVSRASASEGQAATETAGEEAARLTERDGRASKVIRPVWWRRPAVIPYFKLAAAAVIVVGLVLGIWRVFFYQSDVNKGIAALAQAYREQRPVEARISGLDYAPTSVTRGGPPKVDTVSLNRAERILLDEVAEHPSPASHHALGRLYLAEQRFDDAIKQFDEALKTDPNNAQLHSDYGAALLERAKADRVRGEAGKSLQRFAESNEHLTRALELNPSLLEALFNRALCLEHMSLHSEAEKAWRTYLEKDSNSKWADEARQRLRELEERPRRTSLDTEQLFRDFLEAHKAKDDARAWKLISENRDSTRSLIENRLIDTYLNPTKRASDEANQSLEALSYAGRLAFERTGDSFLLKLARFYKFATPSRLDEALQARSLLSKGRDSFSRYNFEEALGFYKDARQAFERAGDACEATFTNYPIGNCYVQQSKADSALSVFQPLAQVCEREGYRSLLAQALYASANANLYLRDFSAAMENSKRSMEMVKEMGDEIALVRTSYQFAEEHRFVNNSHEALDLHAKVLPLAILYTPQPADLWRIYFSISLTLDELKLARSAIDFQKEALQLAIKAEAPRIICRSYNYLGAMLAKSGSYAEATKNLERALEIGNSFKEREVRIEATAYSFLQLGDVHRRLGDVNKAVENYDQAIRSYDELDSKFFGYTARKEKLLCCLEQNGCSSLDQEMQTLLNLFEEHRSKILEESSRNTFFDAEQSIYDVIIDFEDGRKGDVKKAFEYSERSRGRSLRDLISTTPKLIDNPLSPDVRFTQVSQPPTLEEIQLRMPADAQILQYAVLKRSVLLWVLSTNDFHRVSVVVSSEDLNRSVNRFLQLVLETSPVDPAEFTREANDLYDLLIKPVEHLLDQDKQLCIVPDKILNYLPFGALKAEASNQYFIEQEKQGFVFAPSSYLFVTCSEAARSKRSTGAERLLIVGNPLIDRDTFPNLADLQSAAREARTIARFYGDTPPMTGASATKNRVMSEMERSNVIHLATHAIADEWYPLRSKLILAKGVSGASESDSDGVLQAYEIYKLNLERAKLVVLSACRSGVEKYYGGEGMIGLSRPFLAKRIPLVVASLWPVDSDSTADLMISFQRHRKNDGQPTAQALRQAQIEMLKDTNGGNSRPYHWASFVAIGGHADF